MKHEIRYGLALVALAVLPVSVAGVTSAKTKIYTVKITSMRPNRGPANTAIRLTGNLGFPMCAPPTVTSPPCPPITPKNPKWDTVTCWVLRKDIPEGVNPTKYVRRTNVSSVACQGQVTRSDPHSLTIETGAYCPTCDHQFGGTPLPIPGVYYLWLTNDPFDTVAAPSNVETFTITKSAAGRT
jgi:hypothetical protein